MTITYILLSTLLVSLVSLVGVILLALNTHRVQRILLYLVSFAVGAMLANVFFHLLPEAFEQSPHLELTSALILVGMLGSFVLEKFIHWHHCHNLDCGHTEPIGTMMLVGDAMHNITDGVLIATAFLVSVPVGVATTIAVIFHEVPQEIGDFAVLIHSGFTKVRALLWNLISALTAFIGVFAVLLLDSYASNLEYILLPLIAGNFLYIAGSDLIPTLHKQSNLRKGLLQLCTMIIGVAIIYAVSGGGHAHPGLHDHDDHAEEIHEEHDEHLLEVEGDHDEDSEAVHDERDDH